IELMVVVVITAILASIAVPAYNNSIRKSRRTEAKTALLDAAAREERYFATQNIYTTDPSALAYGSGALPIPVGTYYSISSLASSPATATTPGGYVLQITPTASSPQLQDTSCQLFQVDQTGKESSQDNGGNDSSTTCWP
ncbi:MAG: type IV pilin protein, partial [Steroidobacteraceae bacterium]